MNRTTKEATLKESARCLMTCVSAGRALRSVRNSRRQVGLVCPLTKKPVLATTAPFIALHKRADALELRQPMQVRIEEDTCSNEAGVTGQCSFYCFGPASQRLRTFKRRNMGGEPLGK